MDNNDQVNDLIWQIIGLNRKLSELTGKVVRFQLVTEEEAKEYEDHNCAPWHIKMLEERIEWLEEHLSGVLVRGQGHE